jgi:hypothetical protein
VTVVGNLSKEKDAADPTFQTVVSPHFLIFELVIQAKVILIHTSFWGARKFCCPCQILLPERLLVSPPLVVPLWLTSDHCNRRHERLGMGGYAANIEILNALTR